MVSDADKLKDYNDAYLQSFGYWSPWLAQVTKDLKAKQGDQWNAAEYKYLKNQGREAYVFNLIRRVIKLITGYQRKNRLALKIDPYEGSDTRTADIFTNVVMRVVTSDNMLNTLSTGFEQGALTCGLNLMELGLDYTEDAADGDIKLYRRPFNRFLIDPNTTEFNLSNMAYYMTRDYLTQDQVEAVLPSSLKGVTKRDIKLAGTDNKFTTIKPFFDTKDRPLYRYDQFWEQAYKPVKIIIDTKTGKQMVWKGEKTLLKEVLATVKTLKVINGTRKTVTQTIILEDQVIIKEGANPTGLDEYNVAPVWGYFEPEETDAALRVQGMVRGVVDTNAAFNKRVSQNLDLVEGQITSGWKAKAGSVVNKDDLYQSGQSKVIWLKDDAEMMDAERLQPPNLPAGMLQLASEVGDLILTISGTNLEMFGQTENGDTQTSGILSKLRQGAGLTVFQDLFDNYRDITKKSIGAKILKMVQKNYSPDKIFRMTNEQPTKEFYDAEFGKYDAIPVEGILTDSQKQMNYMELRALQKDGAPIPWSAILEAAPMQNKDELTKIVQQEEQKQAQAAQQQAQVTQIQLALIQSEIEKNKANTVDKIGESKASASSATLDRIKAIKELQGIDTERLMTLLKFVQDMTNNQQQQRATTNANS